MSDEGRDRFEIPKDMRSMAEASFEQARKAFDKFLASAQQTAGSLEERGATVRAGAKDISTKAISYAEKNVQASLDYAEKLLQAKDLTEVMRLHSEYVQAQMRALARNLSKALRACSKLASAIDRISFGISKRSRPSSLMVPLLFAFCRAIHSPASRFAHLQPIDGRPRQHDAAPAGSIVDL